MLSWRGRGRSPVSLREAGELESWRLVSLMGEELESWRSPPSLVVKGDELESWRSAVSLMVKGGALEMVRQEGVVGVVQLKFENVGTVGVK